MLEAREFRRVGGAKTMPCDVRVLAATSRKLDKESARRGAFRDDLYFRLSVVTIKVPPLRQRVEDIPLLAQALLRVSMDRNHLTDLSRKHGRDRRRG